MPDRKTQEQFRKALDEKHERMEKKAQAGADRAHKSETSGEADDAIIPASAQSLGDERKKSSDKGQVTADKWNQ